MSAAISCCLSLWHEDTHAEEERRGGQKRVGLIKIKKKSVGGGGIYWGEDWIGEDRRMRMD